MSGAPEHGASLFSFESLHRAWLDCKRGKGFSRARWQFEAKLEKNLIELATQLQSRSYAPSPSVCFVSEQPKKREIFAANFRDRVVHHLLVRQLAPYWEARFIHDSYACRKGKGTLAAVDRVQQFVRQVTGNGSARAWYLQLDIRSYFVRIDKAILLGILERGIARQALPCADELRWLTRVIVLNDASVGAMKRGVGFDAIPEHKSLYATNNVSGLPIGNYTSQFFANVYLDRLDQYVKHGLKMAHYVRYVDDLILLDRDRARLAQCERAIEDFLQTELKLELHPRRRTLASVSGGIDAFGYIVHRHHRLLRRRTVRRFEQHLRLARAQCVVHEGDALIVRLRPGHAERLLARVMSYRGMLRHADSTRQRARMESAHAWIGCLWALSANGRARRKFRPCGAPRNLATQWRSFKAAWPGYHVLFQVGRFYEAYGADAPWLQSALGLGSGRWRPGLGQGAGFHAADRYALDALLAKAQKGVVVVCQTPGVAGAVRACEVFIVAANGSGRPRQVRWIGDPA